MRPLVQRGFTLIEVVISIAITAMVIGGSTYFILKASSEVQSAKNRTQIHVEMTSFIEKMNSIRTNYSSGNILVDSSSGYDVILFMNTWATAGVLIGVVNTATTDTQNTPIKLDGVTNFSTYNHKTIGVQELTKTQLTSLLSNPSLAYHVEFQSDRYYPNLLAQGFSATKYNSGSLLVLDIHIYERLVPELVGSNTSTLASETALPYNLVF